MKCEANCPGAARNGGLCPCAATIELWAELCDVFQVDKDAPPSE